MELILANHNIIFIEESVLIEDGFLFELKKFVDINSKKEMKIEIYVDEGIENKIQDYLLNGQTRKAHLLDGMIDIMKEYKIVKYIKTNSYLDFNELLSVMQAPENSNKYVITQKESVFNSFRGIKETHNTIHFLKYNNKDYSAWVFVEKSITAFYLSKDDYINQIDTIGVDYVYSPKYGYLKIDISSQITGGEGSVYRTYNNMMVKIYNKENITYINFKKLSKMLEMKIYNPFICWPKDLVYVDNNFVGYLMDEVKNAQTLLNLRISNFSTMTHLDRFILCYQFLLNVKYLHEAGILIGDLKPDNILVKSPTEVYFIDCGCYQIEDYSCPVCHPEYTKREFKKDELKQQLRTIDDEYYPINKIAFEILIKKNHTYSPDSIEVENVDKSLFYYPLNLSTIKKQNEDLAIWSSLTPAMREYFYYYFKQGRITHLSEWVNELKIFIDKIGKGE